MKFNLKQGVIPILLASVLWGIGYFLRKIIVNDIHPILFTFFTGLFVALAIMLYYKIGFTKFYLLFKEHPLEYLIISFFGTVFGATFMFFSMQMLDVSVVSLLEKLQPVFTLFLAYFILKENIKLKTIPYVMIAIVSSYFISTENPFTFSIQNSQAIGSLLIIAAAFCWALTSVIGKKVVDAKGYTKEITLMRLGIGAVILFPLFLLKGPLNLYITYSLKVFTIIIFTSIFCTGLAFILYYRGLKHTKASTAGFLELVTPIVTVFLGITFLKETLVLSQFLAMPFLLYSIYKISVYH